MNTHKLCLLVVVVACTVTIARAQTAKNEHGIPDAPTRLTNSATTSTGTMLKRELRWRSNIPLNKTYDQLTPEQKAEFRSLYAAIGENDEPPFPVQGIKPIFNNIKKGQNVMQARGELNLAVTVGADGNAIKVQDLGGVGGVNAREMTQYVQSVFMMAKFKPALCQGTPCTMEFPFKLKLN